jgi:hypothetical protein
MTAIQDIAAERARQIAVEGWDAAHDDAHKNGALAMAAASYAAEAADTLRGQARIAKAIWPWAWSWWKPADPRRDLVRAGALIVAEIERLDRLAGAVEAKL